MSVKNKGWCTEQQIQQSYETYDYLRELHRDTYREFRQMLRSTVPDKRTVVFCRVAEEIVGALEVLVEIGRSAQERVPRVVFEVSVVCSDCTPPPDKSEDDLETGIPAPDPAHISELDHLFDFANQCRRRWARRMRHKNSSGALSKALKKLVAALIKERRHFRETAAVPPRPIEWRDNGPDCSVCHRPAKIIDDPTKHKAQQSVRSKIAPPEPTRGDHEK